MHTFIRGVWGRTGSETRTVICDGADHAYHQTTAADSVRASASTIIGMFPQQPCVLLVYAYDILDDSW
jgi:hypothetical protein